MSTLRYLIIEDHPAFRRGVKAGLDDIPGFECVAEAATGAEGIASYEPVQPDVVLLDLRLPDIGGVECALAILAKHPKAKILVLTTFDKDEDVFRAVQAGVLGYLLKDVTVEELADTMRRVADGHSTLSPEIQARLARRSAQPDLTRREQDVLHALSKGLSNKEIAHQLHISEETAKGYLKSLFQKLRVMDRTQAVVRGIKMGLLEG
jgi:two-component system, NarL family, response regulator